MIQLFRNRLVLVTSLILPIAFSAFFISRHETFAQLGSLGYIAALTLFFITAIGLYTTTVTTLAARRQNLFLKRLRSTAASDSGILVGLLLPITTITTIQVGVILAVLGAVTGPPKNPLLLVVATIAMMVALGLARPVARTRRSTPRSPPCRSPSRSSRQQVGSESPALNSFPS